MDDICRLIIDVNNLYKKIVWLNSKRVGDEFKGYTESEVHCITYIHDNIDSNVTILANGLLMTRGAISKLTKKLIARDLLLAYSKDDNKKEVYFKLTEKGEYIANMHTLLHNELNERDKEVKKFFDKKSGDSVLEFIKIYDKHISAEIEKIKKI